MPFGVIKIGSKRSSFEIISEILKICMGGARKTEIVYQANLNFKILHKYLAKLRKCGFIEERKGLIYTTSRGSLFLSNIREALRLLNQPIKNS